MSGLQLRSESSPKLRLDLQISSLRKAPNLNTQSRCLFVFFSLFASSFGRCRNVDHQLGIGIIYRLLSFVISKLQFSYNNKNSSEIDSLPLPRHLDRNVACVFCDLRFVVTYAYDECECDTFTLLLRGLYHTI